MNLLPCPRVLKRTPGVFKLPRHATFQLDKSLPVADANAIARRLQDWNVGLSRGAATFTLKRLRGRNTRPSDIRAIQSPRAPDHAEGYGLTIDSSGVQIEFRQIAGLRAAVATLRQLLREHGRALPCLSVRDWPDFPRRGVMLDVSRGRVPNVRTLLQLVDHLADFKINEFQLYLEHTFAYRGYEAVWRDWGALTAADIRTLNTRCRELGIDLVPNQNSFGHLREWLAHAPLKKLAEVNEPYEDGSGTFLRHPSTLAPAHPGTLPFLRGLYDQLLPHFTSRFFNVGCDETWDLGRGQSRKLCESKGKGCVYLEFLKRIQREVSRRGRRMMFWGDIILKYPALIRRLPPGIIALNWGYEASHPFEREARQFAKSGVPFYVCPGTSTWTTLIGRHDNALPNLRRAANAGRRHGAVGYLITDWGDGGHPQPLAVSYLPYLAGAALAWCGNSFDSRRLGAVLSRDVFCDSSGKLAKAAHDLGYAHRKLRFTEPNLTPLGTVIAAPPPEQRELFCRNALNYFRRIPAKNVRAALREVEAWLGVLRNSRARQPAARILRLEVELAARMAAQSCRYMLWQQAVAAGRVASARSMARRAIRELRRLDREFKAAWPRRNKGTAEKCSAFLGWRIADYRRGTPARR